MNAVLLAVHVLAAIVAIGPVCVAASMFPPEARRAVGDDPGAAARLPVLARICRTYAVVGIAVPVFGLATASSMGVLTEPWVLVSIVLTLAAAGVLAGVVLPPNGRCWRASAFPTTSSRPPAGSPPPPGCSTCSGRW